MVDVQLETERILNDRNKLEDDMTKTLLSLSERYNIAFPSDPTLILSEGVYVTIQRIHQGLVYIKDYVRTTLNIETLEMFQLEQIFRELEKNNYIILK